MQAFAEGVNLLLRAGIIHYYAEQAGCRTLRIFCRTADFFPGGVAWRIGQAGMQHLHKLRLPCAPLGQRPRIGIGFLVAQRHAGQAVENRLCVIHAYAKAHVHVTGRQFPEQFVAARDDAAHQHIAAAAGVFGQGVHGNVHPRCRAFAAGA